MISPTDYFALTKLASDILANMKKRDHVPFPSSVRADYSLFDAFTFRLSEAFSLEAGGPAMPRAKAVNVTRAVAKMIAERKNDLHDFDRPVFCGVATLAFPGPTGPAFGSYPDDLVNSIHGSGSKPFVGHADEIALIESGPRTVSAVKINVTRVYQAFLMSCQYHGIDAEALFPDPSLIPSYEEILNGANPRVSTTPEAGR